MGRMIVGVSGASGAILSLKTIEALIEAGFDVDLVITKAGFMTFHHELGVSYATPHLLLEQLGDNISKKITLHSVNNFGATIASGSYKTEGMVIVPCSMATLAAVALGLSDNLIRRAADVMIKEKRPLVIVPREAPLSKIHLQHMSELADLGAYIVPPVPAWYTKPQTLEDVENFIVGKILDCLRVEHKLYPKWPTTAQERALQ